MNAKYYVVKKDNVVQEAKNLFDYVVMKLGLESVLEFLVSFLKRMLKEVTSLQQVEAIREFIDKTFVRIVVFLDHLQLGKA